MAHVVEEHGQACCLFFLRRNVGSFLTERAEHASHKVLGAERMLKTRMQGSGVYQVGQSKLADVAKPLKGGVGDDVENEV